MSALPPLEANVLLQRHEEQLFRLAEFRGRQKGRERFEDMRFRRVESTALFEFEVKVIVVSRFAALDCFENVAKTLLAEKDMVFLHHPPSRLIIR